MGGERLATGGLPRLLVVNPNTTVEVTERFVAEARAAAPFGTVIDGVTGTFGAAIVSTRAEAVVASHAALDLLARHGGAYDAAILAISFDTALAAAGDVMPYPVIGITRAALGAACATPGPIGMITFGRVSLPLYDDLLALYGLRERVVGIEVVEVASAAGYLWAESLDRAVLGAARGLVARGAGAIVVCGAAIVGIARRLQAALPVPLIDGAAPAVSTALAAIETFARTARPVPLGAMSGVSDALRHLVAGHGPAASSTLA